MSAQRLQHIDRLKGVAMLMVVIGHVSALSFSIPYDTTLLFTPLLRMTTTIQMPLFIFLSGLVVAQPPGGRKLPHSLHRFIVPMAVMGLLFALFLGQHYLTFLKSATHFGYWYLQVLANFYVLLYVFGACPGQSLASDIAKALALWGLLWFGRRFATWDNDVLCLLNSFGLWPYFMAGFLCRRHAWLSESLCSKRACAIACTGLVAGTVLLLKSKTLVATHIVAACAIPALWFAFRCREHGAATVERMLALVGRKSLYVYLFHFFLAYSLHLYFVGDWMKATGHYVAGFLLAVAVALPVTACCLGAGWLIDRIPPVKRYIFP